MKTMEKIDRNQFAEELKLRKLIREGIKIIKNRKKENEYKEILEESQFRNLVRNMILTERAKPTGNHSFTSINKLERLLHNIIPRLESDYKDLTTDEDQRESFRAHILNAIENSLEPDKLNSESEPDIDDLNEEKVDVKINAPKATDDPMFIDVRDKDPDEDPEDEDLEPEEKEKKTFTKGLEDQELDETGRDEALDTFKSIGPQVEKAYAKLANEQDKNMFYDYLMANMKLYFDQFEEELQVNIKEPESEIYQQNTADAPPPGPMEEESNMTLIDEDLLYEILKDS